MKKTFVVRFFEKNARQRVPLACVFEKTHGKQKSARAPSTEMAHLHLTAHHLPAGPNK
jgi:hypothetical protein